MRDVFYTYFSASPSYPSSDWLEPMLPLFWFVLLGTFSAAELLEGERREGGRIKEENGRMGGEEKEGGGVRNEMSYIMCDPFIVKDSRPTAHVQVV